MTCNRFHIVPLLLRMRHVSLIAALATLGGCAAYSHTQPSDAGWVSIFDGKTLNGWVPKIAGHAPGDNFANTFIVHDKAIRVSYDNYEKFNGQFGHLFYQVPFRSYRLRLQYRFLDPAMADAPPWARSNSGIMFHSQSPETMSLDQPFPISVEFQFVGKIGDGPRPTGSACTPGTRISVNGEAVDSHCLNSTGPTIANGEWQKAELEIHANGDVTHKINDIVVLKYGQVELDPDDKIASDFREVIAILIARQGGDRSLREGYIALQSEGHPVEFRDIQLQEIVATPSR